MSVINLGIVVIGRNEGERLRSCLNSISDVAANIVYVDSGSTDDSVALAKDYSAQVVNLDLSIPFTAARARNAGFQRVKEVNTQVDYIQFIDGDCILDSDWLDTGIEFLQCNNDVAIVCGRRRERFPKASSYNYLCDLEWDTPVGEARACGGDFLSRAEAFQEVNGFNDALIAGEEPDLCFRLRQSGWRIWRIDHEMTLHDADMHKFSQWWRRMNRAGFAFADGAIRNGHTSERYWVREAVSAWVWAAILPIFIMCAGVFSLWYALVLSLIYPFQVLRLYIRFQGMQQYRLTRALSLVVGKFAELSGQLKYLSMRLTHQRHELIEYK
jgi:glycosyltransferase involved in cell wall biosynthesis